MYTSSCILLPATLTIYPVTIKKSQLSFHDPLQVLINHFIKKKTLRIKT